jgi:protein-tyrosine phosphatase
MTGAREPAAPFCNDPLAPLGRQRFSCRRHSSAQLRLTLITMRADIYWIADVPGGRLAILGRPRSGDWLSDEIADWRAAGLTDIVSLPEDHEIRELGLAREAELVEQAGLSFEQFPIPDRGVPVSSEAAQTFWGRLEAKIRSGHSVGIHCRASIERAGLVAVGVLLRLGVPEGVAWQRASKARGRPVPDTDEQRLWVVNEFLHAPYERSHN